MKPPCVIILLFLCVAIFPGTAIAFEYDADSVTLSLNGYLEGKGIHALKDKTPDEDPSCKLQIEGKSYFGSWGMLKITLQGVSDGKVIYAQNDRAFNEFDKIYQDKNPYINLDEAYLDIYTKNIDLRLGIQKFAWGRLDEMNPTDNMNTEDLTDPLMSNESDRKIGVPSVKATIYTDLLNVEIGWIPRYVPCRLPTSEERWFPPIFMAPTTIKTNTAVGDIPMTSAYKDIELPPCTLKNSEIGVRVLKYIAGWDLSLSYFKGYEPMPVVGCPTELTIEMIDFLALNYDIKTKVYLEPRLHKLQVFGFDFMTTYGPFTLRGEWAYLKDKCYDRVLESVLKDELTQEKQDAIMNKFIDEYISSGGTKTKQTFCIDPKMVLQKNSMTYGIGTDYVHEDTTLSLQCVQTCIIDYDKDKPVYFSKNGFSTTFTLNIRQSLLHNTLEIGLSGAYNIEYKDVLISPSMTYSFTDNIEGVLGGLILGGKYDDAPIGQFRDRDEIFAKIKYSF